MRARGVPGVEAAEEVQVLRVDVEVEDHDDDEVEQAEQQHGLANPFQGHPQEQPGHLPGTGRRTCALSGAGGRRQPRSRSCRDTPCSGWGRAQPRSASTTQTQPRCPTGTWSPCPEGTASNAREGLGTSTSLEGSRVSATPQSRNRPQLHPPAKWDTPVPLAAPTSCPLSSPSRTHSTQHFPSRTAGHREVSPGSSSPAPFPDPLPAPQQGMGIPQKELPRAPPRQGPCRRSHAKTQSIFSVPKQCGCPQQPLLPKAPHFPAPHPQLAQHRFRNRAGSKRRAVRVLR